DLQGVGLLGGLALGHQRLQVLHGRGLDRGETEGLEACADMVQPLLLHGPDLGRPLGETADGSGTDDALIGHVSFSDPSERVCMFRGVPPGFVVARRFLARAHGKGHGFVWSRPQPGEGCPSYAPPSPRGEFTGPAATGPRGRLWAGGVRNAARETAPTPKSETWVLR